MQTEFETQVLNIDEKDIRAKLEKIGAKVDKEKLQRRWVFDIKSNSGVEWIRLRTDGEKTTVCHKSRQDDTISGTKENEVEVNDFDKMAELLSSLSFYFDKYYQEDIKQEFFLDGIEFKIDKWPMIPPILEIEAGSEADVKKGLRLLGLEAKDIGQQGYLEIYKKYGIDLHNHKELKFDEKV